MPEESPTEADSPQPDEPRADQEGAIRAEEEAQRRLLEAATFALDLPAFDTPNSLSSELRTIGESYSVDSIERRYGLNTPDSGGGVSNDLPVDSLLKNPEAIAFLVVHGPHILTRAGVSRQQSSLAIYGMARHRLNAEESMAEQIASGLTKPDIVRDSKIVPLGSTHEERANRIERMQRIDTILAPRKNPQLYQNPLPPVR